MTRIAIVGGPRCGKSTHAAQLGMRTYCTDDARHLPWSCQKYFWLGLQYCPGSWCLEGVQVARVLRAGLRVDKVIELWQPHEQLTTRQAALLKGTRKIMEEIK